MKSAEDIIERLKKSFYTPSRKDEKLKVVVICIVISTTFWFFSALNKEDYITQVNYPIELVYDQERYVAISDLPTRIPLEVTGGGWDLMTRSFGFNMSPIRIRLDEPDASRYLLTSSLRGQLTPRIDPVAINFVLLDSLTFNIQRKVSRTFQLELDLASVDLDDGYRISSPVTLNPDTVVWTGPEELINAMPGILFINAGLQNVDRDVSTDVELPDLPDFFSATVESTQLDFNVVRMLNIEVRLEVELANFPDTLWTVNPPSVVVNYSVPETAFDIADTANLRLTADYRLMSPLDSSIQLSYATANNVLEDVQLSTTTVKASKNE